jgi:hypothetical protein
MLLARNFLYGPLTPGLGEVVSRLGALREGSSDAAR